MEWKSFEESAEYHALVLLDAHCVIYHFGNVMQAAIEYAKNGVLTLTLRKAPQEGGGSLFGGIPSTGNSLSTNPHTAAAMGLDPNAQGQGGMAQALPALGQMLMQKFGGGGGDNSEQTQ